MTQLVLTPEQTLLVQGAAGGVVVVDAEGRSVGTLHARRSAWTAEEWEVMKRNFHSDMPRVPSEQVFEKLRRLEQGE